MAEAVTAGRRHAAHTLAPSPPRHAQAQARPEGHYFDEQAHDGLFPLALAADARAHVPERRGGDSAGGSMSSRRSQRAAAAAAASAVAAASELDRVLDGATGSVSVSRHEGMPEAKRAKQDGRYGGAHPAVVAEVPSIQELELPRGLIVPDFDVDALTVDELRKEMVARGLEKEGAKAVLCARLKDAIATGDTSPKRQTRVAQRKKKPLTRKEPQLEEYASPAEFEEAWLRWRKARDENNRSVKLSRERQRQKRQQHEDLCDRRARENEEMESDLHDMRSTIDFLVRAVGHPSALSAQEQSKLRAMVQSHKEKVAAAGGTAARRAANAAAAAAAQAAAEQDAEDDLRASDDSYESGDGGDGSDHEM